jgi:methionine-rich copper-binding protein CopC
VSIAPVAQTGHRGWSRSPVPRAIAAALGALVIVALAAGPVLAHAELVESDPADGATLDTAPATITMRFSQRLDDAKSSFRLSGPDGSLIGTGEPTGAKVMKLTGLSLDPGEYLIKWTTGSAEDGEIDRGQVTFTVAAAATPSPTPNPTENDVPSAEPSSGAPSTEPSLGETTPSPVAPTPAPSAAPTSPTSSTSDVLLPIIVGLLAVAGVGAFVLRRSRGA